MHADRRAPVYPFAAIVGQDELKIGLILNAIDPKIGGVMIMGHRGTAKSTAVRGLADLLPPIPCVADCLFQCAPDDTAGLCASCRTAGATLEFVMRRPAVVDLPLGATEDRVTGTLDIESALVRGQKVFEPGLLARAHRGFLYIDETNLLEDHLVDLLLDVAASGENTVERESISVRHPARFVLIGSGNPEEGELRPQLLDRFGLYAQVETENDAAKRAEIVRRRLAFDAAPETFIARWKPAGDALRERIEAARASLADIVLEDSMLRRMTEVTLILAIDGHRGELTFARAARAHAAWSERREVTAADARTVAALALRHRLRRDPLETHELGHRLEDAVAALLTDLPAGEASGTNGGQCSP